MGSRSETEFFIVRKFSKAVKSFGPVNAARVLNDIRRFEIAWRVSKVDDDLPPGYEFKPYSNVRAPYRLCQIYVGPNNDYRAVVIFPDGRLDAYWIYAFKKEQLNERREVELAKSRAKDLWDTIKGR